MNIQAAAPRRAPALAKKTPPTAPGIPIQNLGLARFAFLSQPQPAKASPKPARRAFPLLDPLPNFAAHLRPRRRPAVCLPRISTFDAPRREWPVKAPITPHDQVAAETLMLRLAALGGALGDMPRQARRYVRWEARCKLARAMNAPARVTPLRPGYVTRLSRSRIAKMLMNPDRWADPEKYPPMLHELDEALADSHSLAIGALERPDTS